MGGSGSGNWWNHSSRALCEQQRRIDLRVMCRRGWLRVGHVGSLSWTIGDEPMGNIGYRVHEYGLQLIYRTREGDDDWRDVDELVRFVLTDQRLGGRRRWLACPRCSRRCSVLYGGSYFRCRRCYRLGYQSQREEPMWRAVSQSQKLRQKYGGSGSLDEPFPDKPKGMHWSTYERICRRADCLEQRVDALETVFFARFLE